MKKLLFVPVFCACLVLLCACRPASPRSVSGYYVLTSGDELQTPYLLFGEKDGSFRFGNSLRYDYAPDGSYQQVGHYIYAETRAFRFVLKQSGQKLKLVAFSADNNDFDFSEGMRFKPYQPKLPTE